MSTVLALCGCLLFIAVIIFIASELGQPERPQFFDPLTDDNSGAPEGDLSEYVRRRNGEAM